MSDDLVRLRRWLTPRPTAAPRSRARAARGLHRDRDEPCAARRRRGSARGQRVATRATRCGARARRHRTLRVPALASALRRTTRRPPTRFSRRVALAALVGARRRASRLLAVAPLRQRRSARTRTQRYRRTSRPLAALRHSLSSTSSPSWVGSASSWSHCCPRAVRGGPSRSTSPCRSADRRRRPCAGSRAPNCKATGDFAWRGATTGPNSSNSAPHARSSRSSVATYVAERLASAPSHSSAPSSPFNVTAVLERLVVAACLGARAAAARRAPHLDVGRLARRRGDDRLSTYEALGRVRAALMQRST